MAVGGQLAREFIDQRLHGRHGRLGQDERDTGIALSADRDRADADTKSPLHRLEHRLHLPVAFIVLPIFGLANAAVPVLGLPPGALFAPVTLGVAAGLLLGKVVGVFGLATLAVRLGLANMPAHASRTQMLGVSLLRGIGFTMSIFITLLTSPQSAPLQAEAKLGVLSQTLPRPPLLLRLPPVAGALRRLSRR